MPDSIAAVPGATVSPTTGINPLDLYSLPTIAPDDNTTIDQDAFLKLLVAQLKYQNPLEPTSNEEFISITAQFTTVERLNELTEQGRSRTSNEALNTAGALVGRTVSFLDQLGRSVQATVDQAAIVGNEVRLITNQGPVSLEQIIAIGPTGPAAPPAASSTDTTPTDTTQSTEQPSPTEESPTTTSSQEATVQ